MSLLPSHTEIIEALGAESGLVGVSDAERRETLPALPRVGALEPRWEALLALRPTLILADSAHRRYAADFERFRLPVKFYPATRARTLDDVLVLIEAVGADVGRAAAARELVAGLKERLRAIDARPRPARRPAVYFEIWPRPLQAVGRSSFQGQLLERAGFDNIVPDTVNEMPLLSAEWVIRARPDVVLHTGVEDEDLGRRPGWGDLPAVRAGRVYRLDADLFSRAGPRAVDALERLREIAAGGRP